MKPDEILKIMLKAVTGLINCYYPYRFDVDFVVLDLRSA